MLSNLIRTAAISRCLLLSASVRTTVLCASSEAHFSTSSTPQTFLAAIIGSSLSSRVFCSLIGSPPSDEDMSVSSGSPAIVNPKGEHKATVIFLHGLGDQGHGWADAFKTECRHDNIKFICPHSSERPVTLNMGMRMPAWYDLLGLDPSAREDTEGIISASNYVHSLIDAEIAAGIPASKICVGGFSMGGALAIYSGLTYSQKIGGIAGLSSFFLQRDKFPGNWTANNQTNIFLGHGTDDFLVPLQIGQLTEQHIKKFNPNVVLHTYRNMAHSSCSQEMRDLQQFLITNLL